MTNQSHPASFDSQSQTLSDELPVFRGVNIDTVRDAVHPIDEPDPILLRCLCCFKISIIERHVIDAFYMEGLRNIGTMVDRCGNKIALFLVTDEDHLRYSMGWVSLMTAAVLMNITAAMAANSACPSGVCIRTSYQS